MKVALGPRLDGPDAPRAPHRLPPRRRLVVEGAKTFTAFSAHDLLDMDSHAKYGRPGFPF